jgi:hypothetical protein
MVIVADIVPPVPFVRRNESLLLRSAYEGVMASGIPSERRREKGKAVYVYERM